MTTIGQLISKSGEQKNYNTATTQIALLRSLLYRWIALQRFYYVYYIFSLPLMMMRKKFFFSYLCPLLAIFSTTPEFYIYIYKHMQSCAVYPQHTRQRHSLKSHARHTFFSRTHSNIKQQLQQ